jgi:hypothetical protein
VRMRNFPWWMSAWIPDSSWVFKATWKPFEEIADFTVGVVRAFTQEYVSQILGRLVFNSCKSFYFNMYLSFLRLSWMVCFKTQLHISFHFLSSFLSISSDALQLITGNQPCWIHYWVEETNSAWQKACQQWHLVIIYTFWAYWVEIF